MVCVVVNSFSTKTCEHYSCSLTIALKCTVLTPSQKIKALQKDVRRQKRKAKAVKEGQTNEELLEYDNCQMKAGHDAVQYAIERCDNKTIGRDNEECNGGGYSEGLDHPIRNSKRRR